MQQLVMEIDTVYITSENSEPKFEQILSYAGPIKANYMQYAHLNILNQNSSSSLPSTKQYLTPKYSEPKFEQILSYAGPSNANCMQYAHPNILNQISSRFCLIDQVYVGVHKSEPKFEQILSYCTKYIIGNYVQYSYLLRHSEPIFEQILVSLIARSARKLVQNVQMTKSEPIFEQILL